MLGSGEIVTPERTQALLSGLEEDGWIEDPAYRSSGSETSVVGLHRGEMLCLLYVSRTPSAVSSEESEGATSEAELPGGPGYTVTLDCADEAETALP